MTETRRIPLRNYRRMNESMENMMESEECLFRNFIWHKWTENLMITKFPNTISSGKIHQFTIFSDPTELCIPPTDGWPRDFYHNWRRILFHNNWKENYGKIQMNCSEFDLKFPEIVSFPGTWPWGTSMWSGTVRIQPGTLYVLKSPRWVRVSHQYSDEIFSLFNKGIYKMNSGVLRLRTW